MANIEKEATKVLGTQTSVSLNRRVVVESQPYRGRMRRGNTVQQQGGKKQKNKSSVVSFFALPKEKGKHTMRK